MTKVIVYARVSTSKQDLQRQLSLAKDYCTLRGYELVDKIVEQESGTKQNRKGIKQLLSLTKEDCDLVVVSELSRITREEEFQRVFSKIDTLRDNGIGIVFLDDPDVVYSKENPISFTQFIMLGVKAQGAREELMKIRDRMKSGRVAKLKANPYMVTSSQISFGFEKYANPNYILGQTPKSLIRINEKEALVIRFCYDMACNGKSCQKIADYLNTTGNIHRHNKGEKLWQAAEVAKMLRNKLYIGIRTIEGVTHEVIPIVSEEVFNLASECISRNRCIIAKESRFNPLKGLLFCGDCGLPMSIVVNNVGKQTFKCLYASYHRKNPNKKYKICNNNYVYVDKVLETVWNATVERLKSDEYYGKSKITIRDCKRQMKNIENEHKQITNEYNEIADDIRKVIIQLDKITDSFLLEILQEKYSSLKQALDAKEKEIRRLGNLHTELENKIREMRSEVKFNEQMTIHEKATFFNKTFLRVEWLGKKFKRKGTLTIHYKNGDRIDIEMANK